ncbi:hypothetical protein PCASD_06466 [Puccinia coronata f. sp. avenae]|uniref:Uncharacterized protein n=1 Tax=Puccinia coronata f. sp. avenae TaxID=200324 RepID=A0A2N5V1T8_9BASI|nr:hypothetical protein PCASD_06466 [Puccinia coronata f. sp. avenae]
MGAESQAIHQQGQSCQHPGMSRGFTVLDSHATSAYRVITLLTVQSDGHRRQTRAPATHLIGIPGSNSGAGTGAGSGDGTSAVRPLRSSTFIPRGRPGLDTPQPSDPQTADNVPRAATREELVQGHSSDSRIRGNVDGRVLPIPISSRILFIELAPSLYQKIGQENMDSLIAGSKSTHKIWMVLICRRLLLILLIESLRELRLNLSTGTSISSRSRDHSGTSLSSTGREQKWKWRRQLLFILPSTFNNRQHNQPTVIDLCDSDNYFDGSNFEARLLAHGIRSPSSLHPLSSTSSHLFKQLSI